MAILCCSVFFNFCPKIYYEYWKMISYIGIEYTRKAFGEGPRVTKYITYQGCRLGCNSSRLRNQRKEGVRIHNFKGLVCSHLVDIVNGYI